MPVDDAASPEDDGGGILARFGTFAVDGVPEFSADLTRQLIEPDVACNGSVEGAG